MKPIDIKSKVFALYDKNKKYPSLVVIFQNKKNSIDIITNMSIKSRLKFAWHILSHNNFNIISQLLEEKNEEEIYDYNNGKGLKRRQHAIQ